MPQCRENGDVSSFAEMLDNIFSPLFAVSIDPSSDPALHYFLGDPQCYTPSFCYTNALHYYTTFLLSFTILMTAFLPFLAFLSPPPPPALHFTTIIQCSTTLPLYYTPTLLHSTSDCYLALHFDAFVTPDIIRPLSFFPLFLPLFFTPYNSIVIDLLRPTSFSSLPFPSHLLDFPPM